MNILDLLFPRRCLGCGRIGKYFCDLCKKGTKPILFNEAICPMCGKSAIDGTTHPRCQTRYGLDGLTSFFHYDGIIRQAVKTLKYRRVSDLASELVSLIPERFRSQLFVHSFQFVFVPIPLHPSRRKVRGYNQAEVVGKLLSEQLHTPFRTDILMRTKKTIPQVDMKKRNERLKNMEGVFSVNHFTENPLSHVLLFDDVFTTGATMRSAANTLKRAGVRYVWAVTVAR